jgi:Mrp family chromosome partitioning ATPase
MKTTVLKLSGNNDFFTQESFKSLRTNVQFCGQDIRTIAVTSCHENEGKTVISLNLAKSFAELGKRVLVVDADMRNSVVAGRHTSVKRPVGLSEVLSGIEEVS